MSSRLMEGFADELIKFAQNFPAPPNAFGPTTMNVPRQAIPTGAAPSPKEAYRPPLPTAPQYQPPQQEQPAAAGKKGRGGGGSGQKVDDSFIRRLGGRIPGEALPQFMTRAKGVQGSEMGSSSQKPPADMDQSLFQQSRPSPKLTPDEQKATGGGGWQVKPNLDPHVAKAYGDAYQMQQMRSERDPSYKPDLIPPPGAQPPAVNSAQTTAPPKPTSETGQPLQSGV